MRRFKVRFNLGRGVNYKKWQVRDVLTGEVIHYNPETHNLILHSCQLHNNRNQAQKIFEGANKFVCAWVRCTHYRVENTELPHSGKPIYYNPRKAPHWTNEQGEDIDDMEFTRIVTNKRQMFADK